MVARINHSIQSALSFLNPLYSISTKSVTSAQFKTRFSFPQNLLLSSSKSRKSMFCTCAIADTKIHNSGQNGEAETFVLTTPLYYVNAPPHMGSAYTTIAADAITRFQRLLGKKVIFVTGTDEHGEKIAAAAVASGSSPREHCDVVSQAYKILWKDVQSWNKSGLKDFSISQASVDWCIPVPNDNKQTIYVWFDALLGYISAPSEDKGQPNLQTAVSAGWPASLDLIGEIGPALGSIGILSMLMSAGLGLPKMVFGHGFLTKDGLKMGKSLGNILEPNELVQKFGSDAVRYFFLREVEFGNDGDYSEDRFVNIVNAHPANTIGNLLNRTLGLLIKNCQSTLAVDSAIAAEGNALKDTVERLNKPGLIMKICHYHWLVRLFLRLVMLGMSTWMNVLHGLFLSKGVLLLKLLQRIL